MTVDQYADKFNELRAVCPGIMLSEDALAEQFAENLNPRHKGTVVPHLGNVSTLRQIIDIAKRTEKERLEAQKAREAKQNDKDIEKAKNKRPTQEVPGKQNGGGNNKTPGNDRKRFRNSFQGSGKRYDADFKGYFNCGELGHMRRECPKLGGSGGSGGGQGNGQGNQGNHGHHGNGYRNGQGNGNRQGNRQGY